MYQATLGLSLVDDVGTSSESNSDYESSPTFMERRQKPKRISRKHKPRKSNKVCTNMI